MQFKYCVGYWYRDPRYNEERCGDWYCNTLVEVYAFIDMVKQYGGQSRCDLGVVK